MEHDLGRLNCLNEEIAYGIKQHGSEQANVTIKQCRRKAFWRELQAMIRFRSPHTVNVHGAITFRADRLVLVMELLPRGDLRALLKDAVETLPEERAVKFSPRRLRGSGVFAF